MNCPFKIITEIDYTIGNVPHKTLTYFGECDKSDCMWFNVSTCKCEPKINVIQK